MKVLNLYAGIGGNRKLWGGVEITAVELDANIAEIYKALYPDDTVIVADAHEYLLKHFREFDFIWASPPCITHSSLNFYNYHNADKLNYPDMRLYQEILLLKHFFKGKWIIENVKPYYKPLIEPTFNADRHLFWSSDFILNLPVRKTPFINLKDDIKSMADSYGYDIEFLKTFKNVDLRKILRNCVIPEIGLYIFEKLSSQEPVKADEIKNRI